MAHRAENSIKCFAVVTAGYLLLTLFQNWGKHTNSILEIYVHSIPSPTLYSLPLLKLRNPFVIPDAGHKHVENCSPVDTFSL